MGHARPFFRILAVTTIVLSSRRALADDGSSVTQNGLRLSLGAGGASRSIGGNADGLFATELTLIGSVTAADESLKEARGDDVALQRLADSIGVGSGVAEASFQLE